MSYNQSRLSRANELPIDRAGEYVLYWMTSFRRLTHNHALDYAVRCANELKKPLVVFEALRYDYPWASERFHCFIMEGMRENRNVAKGLGLTYWPFVATPESPGKGLLSELCKTACLVVADDDRCFVAPEYLAAASRKVKRAVFAVDSNSIVPLSLLGNAVSAAAHLRPRIHKVFAEAWRHRAQSKVVAMEHNTIVSPPFEVWDGELEKTLAKLPIDRKVARNPLIVGGASEARKHLKHFLANKLPRYADDRSSPASPEDGFVSGLSPYFHFGHISIEEVVSDVLQSAYGTLDIELGKSGKRDGFYGTNPNVNGFLDQAITWRDVGHQWHWTRRLDTVSLEKALPVWALATLTKHATDKRAYLYSREEFEGASTHDRLWNAAQTELVRTGTMQNYLRMLWGKKVIEWSATPEDAYQTLVHLNNKYALDGRDPNSYAGILWCFGLFDRPWAPERTALGSVRYMSSDNTAKKFKVDGYLRYVAGLSRAQ